MIALDTNILARYLLNDSPDQGERADRLLNGPEPCTVPITVFLELAWVLESYDFERTEIAKSIRMLCGLRNFYPPNLDALGSALFWYEEGMDFADALLGTKQQGKRI